jgi:rod shape-determining protein MreC
VLDFDGTRKARRRDAAIAGGILLLALVLVFFPVEYQRPVRAFLRGTLLRPFLVLQTKIAERRSRLDDVIILRAQRDSLAALVAAQASLSEENRQLRSALGLTARVQDTFISANVLQAGLSSAESTFLLDVGSDDGVRVGSPVITADGLLGVVWEVEKERSQAIDWTHREFRVSAMTADGLAYGLVEPRRYEYRDQDILALTGAPFQVDVRPGQRVVSSGRGNLIPRGVPIGTVVGIEDADTGWRKSYLIRPTVRPEAARHVLVGIGNSQTADLSDVWHVAAPPDPERPDTTAERQSRGAS